MVTHAPARVLVVEDDTTVADVVTRYLEREGFTVDTVGDGLEALERADAQLPDLVVLDIMLPGIDGLEVCRRLRSRAPVPVVMLTARGSEEDRVLGLELGADDYVSKPFSPRELTARGGDARVRRPRDQPAGARGARPRRVGDPHGPRVRVARVPGSSAAAGVPARRVARASLGIHVRRHLDGDRPHPAPTREDRRRPVGTSTHCHGVGRRLPVRPVMTAALPTGITGAGACDGDKE